MLDIIRIKRKLVDLERYRARLEKITPKDMNAYLKSDTVVKSAVERNLQLISDSELDVMIQLYKGLELRIAGNDESVIDKLEEKLGKGLTEKIKSRRNLRNELIHAYIDSDFDKAVFQQAHDLDDIDSFSKGVKQIIENN